MVCVCVLFSHFNGIDFSYRIYKKHNNNKTREREICSMRRCRRHRELYVSDFTMFS